MPLENEEQMLKDFVSRDPTAKYMFDSERDASQSEICRISRQKGKECITLHMHSKRMFKAMQEQGFFCALPIDPSRTDIECTPIPKS